MTSFAEDIMELAKQLKRCATGYAHCTYPIVHTIPSTKTRKQQQGQIYAAGYSVATPEHPDGDLNFGASDPEQAKRVHQIIGESLSVDLDDDAMPGVTLASQFSVNRLTRFEDALAAWPGPVSAVVYLMDMSDIDVLIEYFRVAANLERYHRVELAVVAPNFADEERYRYPINQLRNIAIGMIRTTHHLLIDADFVPNRALYTEVVEKRFAEMWRTDSESSIGTVAAPNPSRTAFVVPCVALVEDYSGAYPETIDELRSLFDRRLAYITDSNAGHGLTADKVFLRSC
ncbi:hypothetical protein THASP1DRAFT_31358 [Thamnocephalis sphaerospora]|uniref:Glycosyl-transferase for dystroglycan-domain-containing protein n=1 Tax=Thamnocephalis sphaerospora TaxID=78915 RepID=A0A4P9XLX1_9FUNG|nr:hypothetical protein THASP1DRAFT_31358 [Thamnocephalis sphaerospora]|eukprot:RKP06832.1 hypothetical protein THASP1DRAFT_31358 [Thamnocephalis sphaerospora]